MSLTGHFFAICCTLCWAVTAVSFAYAGRRVGSLPVNIIRLVMGVAFFALISAVRFGTLWPADATPHQWLWMSISGFIGFFLGDLFLFRAFLLIGTRLSMLMMTLAPLFTSLLAWLMLGEALSPAGLLGMALTMGGIALVVGERGGAKDEQAPVSKTKGLLFALLGAMGQGSGAVLAKLGMARSFEELPAMLAGDAPPLDAFQATQIRVTIAMLSFIVLVTLLRSHRRVLKAHTDWRAMIALLIGAFLGPFLGATLFNKSLQYVPSGITQTIVATVPIVIMPLTLWIEKDQISRRAVLGSAIAVSGIFLLCH
ncbi:DMT family transporter [Pontiella sp.]|uniref:DMT family transporter n=1 Tax=Pontiella sp. TaxID=2837462 RepID=UPI00356A6333